MDSIQSSEKFETWNWVRRSQESAGISLACSVQHRLGQPSSSSWWCMSSCRMTYLLSGARGLIIARGTPFVTCEVPCSVDGSERSITTLTRCARSPSKGSSWSLKKSVKGCCGGLPRSVGSAFGTGLVFVLVRHGMQGTHLHLTIYYYTLNGRFVKN
jgi:hypothetical protein